MSNVKLSTITEMAPPTGAEEARKQEDNVFKREFSRYKLDTYNVSERSLEDEFLHVLSIIHRCVHHARSWALQSLDLLVGKKI